MYPPARRPSHAVHVRRGDERCEDVARPVDQIGAQLPRIVVLDEALQASVLDGAKIHPQLMYCITVRFAILPHLDAEVALRVRTSSFPRNWTNILTSAAIHKTGTTHIALAAARKPSPRLPGGSRSRRVGQPTNFLA